MSSSRSSTDFKPAIAPTPPRVPEKTRPLIDAILDRGQPLPDVDFGPLERALVQRLSNRR